jgi:hypothetical protein
MSKIQSPFLKRAREAWRVRFPFLEPVEIDEVPKRDKGGNYRCGTLFAERGLAYFFSYQFSTRRLGEFTLDVTISDSLARSVVERRWASDVTEHKLGSYRIGSFIDGKDHWWALRDVDAGASGFLESLGLSGPEVASPRVVPGRWRPSSFDIPISEIYDQAIVDVSDKLSRYVLPKLNFPETIHPA